MTSANNTDKPTKIVLNQLFSSSKNQLLKDLQKHLQGRSPLKLIFTPNLEQLVMASEQKYFAKTLGQADILLPDGMGLVWGARFLSFFGKSSRVEQRISGREVVGDLLGVLEGSVALVVGGRDYHNLVESKLILEAKPDKPAVYELFIPEVNGKAFWTSGFDDAKSPKTTEQEHLRALIGKLKPSVVFAALGAPNQEFWLTNERESLEKNKVKIAMAVGGSFDVLLGKLLPPPVWMQKAGLEWLYRLVQEPWRWRRQLRLLKAIRLIAQAALKD